MPPFLLKIAFYNYSHLKHVGITLFQSLPSLFAQHRFDLANLFLNFAG